MKLSREVWVRAALGALEAGGPSKVAVLPLSKELGATRGSFYWHFSDRAELLDAALEFWETQLTDEIIRAVESETNPALRLRALLRMAFTNSRPTSAEAAFNAHSDDPIVGPAVGRVASKRISYLSGCFAELGFSDAQDRAIVAYSAYVGWIQLRHTATMLARDAQPDPSLADAVHRILIAE